MQNLIDFRFLNRGDVQYVAACDVKKGVRDASKHKIDSRYGNTDAVTTNDFREVLARDDIDAVVVATPEVTDQGLVGWGESHAPAAPRVHQAVINDLLAPMLIGQDARDVEALWEKMYSSQRLRGYATGFYTESIAGMDLALWDLLGRYTGQPLYRLLGGYRDRIQTSITWGTGVSL